MMMIIIPLDNINPKMTMKSMRGGMLMMIFVEKEMNRMKDFFYHQIQLQKIDFFSSLKFDFSFLVNVEHLTMTMSFEEGKKIRRVGMKLCRRFRFLDLW